MNIPLLRYCLGEKVPYKKLKMLIKSTLLLVCFASLNGMEGDINKELEIAIESLDAQGAEQAISRGAEVTSINRYLFILTTMPVENEEQEQQRLALMKLLIRSGADINQNSRNGSLLDYGAYSGNFAVVKLLLNEGADPLLGNPLAHVNNAEIMMLLLQAGANPNRLRRGISGKLIAPLENAAIWPPSLSHQLIRLLVEYGADYNLIVKSERMKVKLAVSQAFKDDLVMQAIALHKTGRAKELLKDLLIMLNQRPIDKEELDEFRCKLNAILLLAIAQGNDEVVRLLLQNFRVYLSLEEGLVRAAQTGHLNLVREMNEESKGNTSSAVLAEALTRAAIRGHRDSVLYLLNQDHAMRINLEQILTCLKRIVSQQGGSQTRQIYELIVDERIRRMSIHHAQLRQGVSSVSFLEGMTRLATAFLYKGN